MDIKILLIDGETRIRQTFAHTLELAGYTVISAENGEAGLTLFIQNSPDLVFLDLRLPDMDALGVLQALRAHDPEINVILIAGHSEADTVIAALRAGASVFLSEPVDQVTLESVLRRVEERIHLKRQLRASQEALRQQNVQLEAQIRGRTAELEEALAKYRVLFDMFPLGITISDATGQIIEGNRESVRLLGISREEHAARQIDGAEWRIIRPDGSPMPAEEYASVGALKERRLVENVEMGIVKPDADITWISVTAAPLGDDRVVITYNDITQRKRTEEALRESEQRYRYLFENAPVGIFQTNSQGRALVVNAAMAHILGLDSPEEAVAYYTNLGEQLYVHAEQREQFLRLLKKQGFVENFEYEARTADGRNIWLTMNARIIPHDADETFVIEGFTTDISQRKQAEDALRGSEARLRSVVENMPVMMDAFDDDNTVTVWNRECERVTGYSATEIIGNPRALEILYPDAAYRARMLAELGVLGFDFRDQEWTLTCKDGAQKTISWFNISDRFPIPGWNSWAIGMDVTARVQGEAQVKRLNTVLRAIRNVNQLILRAKDRDHLLQGACDNLVKTRGYYDVWIALFDEEGKLETTAQSGLGAEFLTMVERLERGELPICGKQALAQPGTVVTQRHTCRYSECPLAASYAGREGMIVRLEYGEKVYGLLTVSIPADIAADQEERTLLLDVARDIGFALYSIKLAEAHKRAEVLLRESEERFRGVFETSSTGIAIVDTITQQFQEANASFLNILGYSLEELRHLTVIDITYPEDWKREMSLVRAYLDGTLPVYAIEKRYIRKDGELRWVRTTGDILFTDPDKPPLAIANVEDITERKRAEAALRESEERFRQIYEHMTVGVAEVALDFRIKSANEAYCRMLGYREAELIGKHLRDITHPDMVEENLRKQSQLGRGEIEHYRLEKQFIHKNGSVIYGILDANLVRDVTGKPAYFLGSVLDITQRKYAEVQLKQALAEKTTLLQELYHRTRNNMQVICALLDFQAEYIDDQRVLHAFVETQNRIQSMALVHQKLYQSQDLSRINLQDYVYDLTSFLLQSYHIPHNKIEFTFEMEDVFVLIDTAIPCSLILNEVLSNALKHAFPDDRRGEITVRLRRLEEEVIELQVSDNGIGVPANFDFRRDGRLGLKIILTLGRRQLHGQVRFERHHGVTCRLRFKDNLYTPRV
ncbi:MAG: PAS domain S-box protein [Anaerolineae bacterium]|nr:PAS domain S-box protein [Anaerolineae bacterium]